MGPQRCSFCRRPADEVNRLISGPDGVFICDECVHLCMEVLHDEVPHRHEDSGEFVIERGLTGAHRLGELNLPRLADTPDITVEIVQSNEEPGGVSELAVPPVGPAVANALYAATGRRYRQLPIRLGS